MEIIRKKELRILKEQLQDSPGVAILGLRQCGKTTLANQFTKENVRHFKYIILTAKIPGTLPNRKIS